MSQDHRDVTLDELHEALVRFIATIDYRGCLDDAWDNGSRQALDDVISRAGLSPRIDAEISRQKAQTAAYWKRAAPE